MQSWLLNEQPSSNSQHIRFYALSSTRRQAIPPTHNGFPPQHASITSSTSCSFLRSRRAVCITPFPPTRFNFCMLLAIIIFKSSRLVVACLCSPPELYFFRFGFTASFGVVIWRCYLALLPVDWRTRPAWRYPGHIHFLYAQQRLSHCIISFWMWCLSSVCWISAAYHDRNTFVRMSGGAFPTLSDPTDAVFDIGRDMAAILRASRGSSDSAAYVCQII